MECGERRFRFYARFLLFAALLSGCANTRHLDAKGFGGENAAKLALKESYSRMQHRVLLASRFPIRLRQCRLGEFPDVAYLSAIRTKIRAVAGAEAALLALLLGPDRIPLELAFPDAKFTLLAEAQFREKGLPQGDAATRGVESNYRLESNFGNWNPRALDVLVTHEVGHVLADVAERKPLSGRWASIDWLDDEASVTLRPPNGSALSWPLRDVLNAVGLLLATCPLEESEFHGLVYEEEFAGFPRVKLAENLPWGPNTFVPLPTLFVAGGRAYIGNDHGSNLLDRSKFFESLTNVVVQANVSVNVTRATAGVVPSFAKIWVRVGAAGHVEATVSGNLGGERLNYRVGERLPTGNTNPCSEVVFASAGPEGEQIHSVTVEFAVMGSGFHLYRIDPGSQRVGLCAGQTSWTGNGTVGVSATNASVNWLTIAVP